MKKVIFVLFIILFISSGCNDKTEDTHYKPSEYKHELANSSIGALTDDIDANLISLGYDSDPEVILEKFNNSITRLEGKINTLNEGKNDLKKETDLSKKELKDWNEKYNFNLNVLETKLTKVKKDFKEFKYLPSEND